MSTRAPSWMARLTSLPVAIGLLVAFWIFLMASVSQKSLTADEIAHATAGYTYWRYDDYRFNPENGNLPQRVMGLPLWLGGTHFPPTDSVEWRTADEWKFGYQWFHQMGNDVAEMLFRGRAAIGLVTALLGAVVWWWSRRLFGPAGGTLSLLLFALNPTILANGALMTSDATAALCFLAATAGIWAVLHRVTPLRVVVGGGLVGLLFVAKMSAPLIIPIALTLAFVRVLAGQPLPVWWRDERLLTKRSQQIAAIVAVALLQTLLTWAIVWAFFGFRYSAFLETERAQSQFAQKWELVLDKPDPLSLVGHLGLSPAQNQQLATLLDAAHVPKEPWAPSRVAAAANVREQILDAEQRRRFDAAQALASPTTVGRFVEFAREHRLLPEAYLFGTLHTLKFSHARSAFLNGEVRVTGWRSFFPYTFLVKTPLALFALAALAVAAALARRRNSNGLRAAPSVQTQSPAVFASALGFPAGASLAYQKIPLLVLFSFYWAAVLTSHLNIGHRHLLVIYPPLFILVGLAADWLRSLSQSGSESSGAPARGLGWATVTLVAVLAGETLARFPNYLAYFNLFAGGPSNGYRHLVDSSLDWGQELPAVKAYLQRERPSGPVYLSYFGNGSPNYYQIPAQHLYSYESQDMPPPLKLVIAPVAQAQTTVQTFLQTHSDYSVAGSARAPDNSALVLLLKDPDAFRLKAGIYLVSATMLQPVLYNLEGPLGPWNERYEAEYQTLSAQAKPFLNDDPRVRITALRSRRPEEWAALLQRFDLFRFARLTAWLRQREPNDQINYSILVYRLTESDLAQALEGPAPERGIDVPRLAEAGQERELRTSTPSP